MQPQRETITDCLADVIHILHIGAKSGTLTVERGEGSTLEEGLITFIDGRVVDAQAAQRSGLAAFNYLNTWQKCRFAFINHAVNSPRQTQPLPPRTPSLAGNGTAVTALPFDTMTPMSLNGRGRSTGPRRLPTGEMTLLKENAQLPRVHRRLLLLINGQRSVSELARLMARSHEDVQILLDDLERFGLIQQ